MRGEPEGVFQDNRARRHRAGAVWHALFLASTLIGIVALVALLINIINGAFGYVAVQNEVDPITLVRSVKEKQLLDAPNTQSGEDDTQLAEGVAGDPNATGFFGYAYYLQNQDRLKVIAVDGVTPNAETAESGAYPLSRPLYIYTTAELMQEKPQVAAFVNFYLASVGAKILDVGYFPASEQVVNDNTTAWLKANGLGTNNPLPPVEPASLAGDVATAGSSTVYPLTQRMADDFKAAGFPGNVAVANVGSTAGLRAFCVDGSVDIANASRPIQRTELEACRKLGREPVGFRVGTDALAVVARRDNPFLTNLSLAQLQTAFTAASWSEVDAAFPNTPIARFVPGVDSGTLDFFVEAVFDLNLASLPKETLIAVFKDNVSAGLFRRYESEKPFAERPQEDVYALVQERVVAPKIVQTWNLIDSLTRRAEIEASLAQVPNGTLEFRSWLTTGFLTQSQNSDPQLAGVRTAILGSLWTILITVLFAFPVGVAAAIYLEEYATDNLINRAVQTNINNLAGVPSIIYGILGLAIFVRVLEPITSGVAFGAAAGGDQTTLNGRTILSAGLTLGLLVLPVIIITAQEAIRAVPRSLRQASFGLGATKWQTVWNHVLPTALPGILTGTILAVSRAIGETAPLVVIGASTFITFDPSGPFSKFTTLPIQIYQWASRAQGEYRALAAAAIVVLLALLLTLNFTAILLRNRFSKRRLT